MVQQWGTALVTGASSGIGKATAAAPVARGTGSWAPVSCSDRP